MVPTALVRPSLNTSLWSQCRYSGVLMNRKWTEALSPVRKQSLFMDKMVAVCLMLPQWTEWRLKRKDTTETTGKTRLRTLRRKQWVTNPRHIIHKMCLCVSLLLTHSLVSWGYRSGMMKHQDLSLKLPGGLWAQPWGHHHHAFPYGRALDLYKGSQSSMWF